MQGADLVFSFDFYSFWAAARVALAGGNVYDANLIHEAQLGAGWPVEWQTHKFPYPPWAIIFFLPFGLLPFPVAQCLWALVTLLIVFHSGVLISKALASCGYPKFASVPLLCLVLLSFPPLFRVLILGQNSFLPLYGLALGIHLVTKRREFWSGLALSLTLLKPQQFLFLYGILISSSVMRRHWVFIAGGIVGIIIQLGLAELLLPNPVTNYLEFVQLYLPEFSSYPVRTISAFIEGYVGSGLIRPYMSLGSLILGLLCGAVFKPVVFQSIFLVVPISLLLSPYYWFHDTLILLPAYLFVLLQGGFLGRAFAALFFLIALYLTLTVKIEELTWIFTLVICALVWNLYLRSQRPPSRD